MKAVLEVFIPSADSYGKPITPYISIPNLQDISKITDYILSWSKQLKPGCKINIEFTEDEKSS